MHVVPGLEPSFELAEKLIQAGLTVTSCYQCRKCSSGCPLTFAMDLLPDQVIRLALLGQEDKVFGSSTIWVCSSCETCTTRCPNDIDIAGVMDWLKEEALRRGYDVPQPGVSRFYQTFLRSIRLGHGRIPEAVLLGLYTMKSGQIIRKLWTGELFQEMRLGRELRRRGRLAIKMPPRLKGAKEMKEIFDRAETATRGNDSQ
ncbi:MAG: 4Fe-4S dicluster domain-containing protein [Desulfobaccales bacterium]